MPTGFVCEFDNVERILATKDTAEPTPEGRGRLIKPDDLPELAEIGSD